MKKHLILLGPPGAGKDTQGKMLAERLNVPLLSSGDLIRKEIKENTPFGLKFKELTEHGYLVPDEFMNEYFSHILGGFKLEEGFILNGFPRTVNQAKFLDEYLNRVSTNLDAAIFLNVDTETLIKRLSGRRICKKCGAVYNIYFSPPKVENVCDKCGGELIERADDSVEAVKTRINVYFNETKPLIDFYENKGILKVCDASRTPLEVLDSILEVVNDCN